MSCNNKSWDGMDTMEQNMAVPSKKNLNGEKQFHSYVFIHKKDLYVKKKES